MRLEDELRTAFDAARRYEPSPDLYARVRRTVAEDDAYRRRVRRRVLGALAAALVTAAWLGTTAVLAPTPGVPGWAVEVLVAVGLALTAVFLAPVLRRFGEPLLLEVSGEEDAARRFSRLLEVAFYLICAGYILATTSFSRQLLTSADGALVQSATVRIGGLLLLLGVLHTLTIIALPALRLVVADTRWRRAVGESGRARAAADPRLRLADRVATGLTVIVVALPVLAVLLLLVFLIILGLT